MDFSQLRLFSMLASRLAYNSERQDILSKNIANADTPAYQSFDLKPLDFKNVLRHQDRKMGMAITSASHQNNPREVLPNEFRDTKDKNFYEKTLTGNKVSIEQEMMKMSQNSFDYQEAINIYKKTTEIFRTAIGR